MSGQGFGGVIVALLNILTLGIFPNSQENAALMFFLVALAVIAVCIASFHQLVKSPIVVYYVSTKMVRAMMFFFV